MRRNEFLLAAAVIFAACGGGSDRASTVQTVGAAGATLKAGAAMLTIPAGALKSDTPVTLREAEQHHQGRAERVEVEPHGTTLLVPAELSVKVDDNNAKVKMHDGNDDPVDTEIEDRNHGVYKTSMSSLGEVEVELEHGAACASACPSGQECDDGTCKAHVEDANAPACNPICPSGQECDDGACKAHGGGTGGTVTCNPACASGLECDNGICKAHKA